MGEWVRTTDGTAYRATDWMLDRYLEKQNLLLLEIDRWRDTNPEYAACLDDLEALVLR